MGETEFCHQNADNNVKHTNEGNGHDKTTTTIKVGRRSAQWNSNVILTKFLAVSESIGRSEAFILINDDTVTHESTSH